MAGLIIRDLAQNDQLDQQAMREIVGGSASGRMAASVLARNLARRSTFAQATRVTRELTGESKVSSSPTLRSASR